MTSTLIDTGSEFGARANRRLREEPIGWLTTVAADGTPQSSPVWFLWDGDTVTVYSRADAARLRNIARNPRISLHLDGDGLGGDVVVVTGSAHVVDDVVSPDANQAYLAKYREMMADRLRITPERFARTYSIPIRIGDLRVRGH